MDDSWDDAALAALDAAEERAIAAAAAAAAVPTSEKNIASHPAAVSEKKEEHDCDKWDAAASGSNAIEVSMPPEKRPMENDTDEWDDPAMLAALDAAEAAMSPQQPKKQRKLETTRQGEGRAKDMDDWDAIALAALEQVEKQQVRKRGDVLSLPTVENSSVGSRMVWMATSTSILWLRRK